MRHGYGTEVDKHGNLFEGQWQTDEKSGQGKLTLVDGSSYEGAWKKGKFHGQGTLTISEASIKGSRSQAASISSGKVTGDSE